MSMVKIRQKVERDICRKTVETLLEAGYELGVNDSEEVTLKHSKDPEAVMQALMTTDDDWLLVWIPGMVDDPPELDRPNAWVHFVYGNDGWDVISDYTMNIREQMEKVERYVEETWG